MTELRKKSGFEMIYVIINYGMGSKILHEAKKHGVFCGTVFYGRGTVNNKILKFLSLYDEQKEIVLLGADTATAESTLRELNKQFKFEKPHHGIVFTVEACVGIGLCKGLKQEIDVESEEGDVMYQVIFTIVNRGRAEDVIEAAQEAGSKGGTVVHARGAGADDTSRLFHMEIEPEKEMVMILSKRDVTEAIVSAISRKMEIEKPGHGIIFVQDVKQAYGIYDK